jgi:putative tryptophan/tyrosine transport system substrate-binding protein
MRSRREFITLLGGAAAAWPLAARAQQAKLPTIGFLGASTPLNWNPWTAAFVQRLASKRVEILHELLPDLRRMAIIGNVDYEAAVREIGEVQAAAAKLGLNADVLAIRHARDVVPAFETLKNGTQALYVCPDALVNANHARINTLALGSRLATMHPIRDYVGAGGLMSYGASTTDLFRRAGDLVDKILKGAKPADLPVEQPTKFELVINLTTAKALRLTIPEQFLLRADEIID